MKIVGENPDISERQLLRQLKKDRSGIIVIVDRESAVLAGDVMKIHFAGHNGKEKAVPLSALGGRLSRAKAKNRISQTG